MSTEGSPSLQCAAQRPLTVSIAPDGALWVGTADGVARRGADGAWRSWGTSQGLSAPIVVDIAFDPVGNAWLATTGGGVSVLLRQWGDRAATVTTLESSRHVAAFSRRSTHLAAFSV